MAIKAGLLRDRIELLQQQETRSAYGETTNSWTSAGSVWANVNPLSMSEQLTAQSLQSPITHRVTIRYRDDVEPTWRFSYRGKTFDIHEVLPDAQSGREHLTITAQQVQA